MEKVASDEAPNRPNPLGVHDVRRPLSDVLGTEDVSIVYYELGPGEQFSGGLHTHHDQEEVFFVQEGTVTFEVRELRSGSERSSSAARSAGGRASGRRSRADGEGTDPRDGTVGKTVDVEAEEIVRFPPGQFQCGRNETDQQVRGLALGAPGSRHNWEDIESLAPCEECGDVTSHGVRVSGAMVERSENLDANGEERSVSGANTGSSDESDAVEEPDQDGHMTVYCNDCGNELF